MHLGQAKRKDVEIELEAQITKLTDAGIKPTHLDGHKHCHTSPKLAELIVELAEKCGIRATRLPQEPLSHIRLSLPKTDLRLFSDVMLHFFRNDDVVRRREEA
ncbi:MAG TPA: ChbG/HpnK family deacetylase [Candidatus Hydrogenedentes bacterium]|nr:ChbG/HpnK family deacetylase [Candidatus Hydrogenedentota bacterium]